MRKETYCGTLVLVSFLCLFSFIQAEKTAPKSKPTAVRVDNPYTWPCRNNTCTKVELTKVEADEVGVPLDICKLNCGEFGGSLWPRPTGKVELGANYFGFYPQNVVIRAINAPDPGVKELIDQAIVIFTEYLLQTHPDYKGDGVSPFPVNSPEDPIAKNILYIDIATVWTDKKVKIGTDESYDLALQLDDTLTGSSVSIVANTYFGARHALETLSQLIAYDEISNSLRTLDRVLINDSPAYAYRGLIVDTSRNFIPMDSLKRVLDAMSYNKMNMFHWHITDTHSFPFYSKSVPEMTQYGAYSQRQIYTIEDMTELVKYATVRGIKIVSEFDAPAHVGNGWEWGPAAGKGDMALCINKEPWSEYCVEPPCGQLNPINEEMYNILGKIYGDMLQVFDNDLFHMGGDEVKLTCWEQTQEIIDHLEAQGKNVTTETLTELWGQFQTRAYDLVAAAQQTPGENFTAVMWTSELASIEHVQQYLPNDKYIIQIWTTGADPLIGFLVQNGYKTIFSNYDAWYLDCGYGAWVGTGNNWCSPYKGWQLIYDNNPLELLKQSNMTQGEIDEAFANGLIVGGEGALWMEQSDENSIESKLWPRGAAIAERLWSNPSTSWKEAETRMIQNRKRMVTRGLRPDRLQPEWCRQNEQLCY